jgi:predicted MFS family arabinose efflux permease
LLLVVPLMLGRELGWPLWSWACLLLSLPAFGVFVAIERRATGRGEPLLNLAVLARPPVAWALGARLAAASTYFALLFVLALFLQQGLGETPLFAGLALVSWVAAFGLAAPALRVAPARLVQQAAWLGALAMVLAYLALGAAGLDGRPNPLVLAGILGLGGFGFGVTTAALLDRLMAAVGDEHAADLSGLYQATSQVAGVAGVATFGTLYLALGWLGAPLAFALTCLAFGAVAAVAALAAAQARPRRVAVSVIAGRVIETQAHHGAHGYAGD